MRIITDKEIKDLIYAKEAQHVKLENCYFTIPKDAKLVNEYYKEGEFLYGIPVRFGEDFNLCEL